MGATILSERGGGRTPPTGASETRILPAMQRARIHRGGVLAKVLVVLVLVVVLAVVGAVVFLDSIVKTGIAAAGTHALGAKTAVRSVSIGIVSGKTSVEGLVVDNPKGYSDAKFVELGSIAVDAGLSSFTGEKIVIDRVALADLVVEIEKGADGTLNVNAIADHLKEVTGTGGEPAEKPDEKPAEPAGESKEAVVKELRLERIRVNLRNLVGGKDGVVEVKLPDIVLRDLSSKGGVDVLASELSGVVVGSVMQAVIAANIEGLGSEVIGGLQNAVGGIGEAIGGALEGAVTKGVEEVGAALEGVGQKLGESLGDLGKGVTEGAGKMLEGAGESLEKGVGGALKGLGDGLFGGGKKDEKKDEKK
ncbi:MAG: hypothetical protein RI967_75 [Planctomycetota bacterium]